MSQFIEVQRLRLEETDVLRNATSKRFRKNPSVIPSEIRQKDDILLEQPSKPHKVTMLQLQELKVFNDKYDTIIKQLLNLSGDIKFESLQKIEDKEQNFRVFDSLLEDFKQKNHEYQPLTADLKSIYSMYSSAPMNEIKTTKKGKMKVKRKHIISEEVSKYIDTDNLFSAEEYYGKYIDIKKFHDTFQSLTKAQIPYIEYLKIFHRLPVQEALDSPQYEFYIKDIRDYLIQFITKSELNVDIKQLLATAKTDGTDKVEGEANSNGEIYCKACDKSFSKESVYKGHLEGKKHKNNLKKVKTIPEVKIHEAQIQVLVERLMSKITDTVNNIERQEGMTERERMIEQSELAEVDSEYTTANSDSSDDEGGDASDEEDKDLFKDLPIGPDGTPIPFWLYKLQGLHHTYNCEICGNMSYQGRMNFEKHFSSLKHQNGLKMLGIDSSKMSLFVNITTIDEALELWKNIKREERIKEGEAEADIEVEDEDGNVMTERDYIQLKKQGLI